jgi:adenine-specific DNA methylase
LTLESQFDVTFTAILALREKQIQQSYRPVIGVHKWFARRPGTVFRNLLLAEFNGTEPLETSYWRAHNFGGVIADPFMGGGTPIFEANRLGFSVVGADINPMAYWIVRQSLVPFEAVGFRAAAEIVATAVELKVGDLYRTSCATCHRPADVKYFLWVKVLRCPVCGTNNDLFPGYLLAEDTRHPKNVVACADCGELNECSTIPTAEDPAECSSCRRPFRIEGPAKKSRVSCSNCSSELRYPGRAGDPPDHRMWAIEYHCAVCKPTHDGRFFKKPGSADLEAFAEAARRLTHLEGQLPIPNDPVPSGDETDRLHRWGYTRWRQMFNERQLLGLGLLLQEIQEVGDRETRHALLTVFSDFLRYQNMLCRYDTYALKCQDIFSVHGFPVGLVQCENNVLGIPRVGSGSFRHFVEKYRRAKEYCQRPFETRYDGKQKRTVFIQGERIEAVMVDRPPDPSSREAQLSAVPATEMPLVAGSLDGVFTDPPYFDNVQYAELMDFCYVWLRQALAGEFDEFTAENTRAAKELTGNATAGRGLDDFTAGLSAVFRHYAAALKPEAAFVFTYHHNDPGAYVPLVVAILDAGLDCTATLPVPAEMGASLHIAGTGSSVLDSVFVCRAAIRTGPREPVSTALLRDVNQLEAAGIKATAGDIRCLRAGHIARVAINQLQADWDESLPLRRRIALAAAGIAWVTDSEPSMSTAAPIAVAAQEASVAATI